MKNEKHLKCHPQYSCALLFSGLSSNIQVTQPHLEKPKRCDYFWKAPCCFSFTLKHSEGHNCYRKQLVLALNGSWYSGLMMLWWASIMKLVELVDLWPSPHLSAVVRPDNWTLRLPNTSLCICDLLFWQNMSLCTGTLNLSRTGPGCWRYLCGWVGLGVIRWDDT